MSQLQDRIAQFRKMAQDDPDNELGHYRLGQLLSEAGQYEEAAQCFQRTLVLSPQFSKAFQLLADAQLKLGRRDEAVQTLNDGYRVAATQGDNKPREEMGQMLAQLGEPVPVTLSVAQPKVTGIDGFICERPGCLAGVNARRLSKPPLGDAVGQQIYEKICAECWHEWLRNYSIKVINELRLDLSTERGAEEYDRYMREFFGLT